jgi:hypothetical protein
MGDQQEKPSDAGVVSRLAGRGEEAITRLMEELGKNPRVTDALGKAMSAKGRVDETTRKTLGQFGLAPADEVSDLRSRVEGLEKRLAQMEAGSAPRSSERKARSSTSEGEEGSTAGSSLPSSPSADSSRSEHERGGGSGRAPGGQGDSSGGST